jgi:hypothetical protein
MPCVVFAQPADRGLHVCYFVTAYPVENVDDLSEGLRLGKVLYTRPTKAATSTTKKAIDVSSCVRRRGVHRTSRLAWSAPQRAPHLPGGPRDDMVALDAAGRKKAIVRGRC